MKKMLCDINVFIDIFLKRKDFYPASAAVFAMAEKRKVKGCVSGASFNILFYLLQKELSRNKASEILKKIRSVFCVAPVTEKVIDYSIGSSIKDFEDAVQYYCAYLSGADFLVTRNKRDYKKGDKNLHVLTPAEFIVL